MEYRPTLSSAKAYSEAGMLESWIHQYLVSDGRNVPFSDGLKQFKRYYLGPYLLPLRLFHRCAGPEPEMQYQIDEKWWQYRVAELEKSIQSGADMPPLIINYVNGRFELNDGNHRHKAYENLNVENVWVIIWTTGEKDLEDFLTAYRQTF